MSGANEVRRSKFEKQIVGARRLFAELEQSYTNDVV